MTTKNSSAAPAKRVEDKRPGFFMDLLRRLILEKPLGTFGLGVIIIFFAAGIFSKFIMPFAWIRLTFSRLLKARLPGFFWARTNWGATN